MTKTILITGGHSGLGAALARHYSGSARLLLTGSRPGADIPADQREPEDAAQSISDAVKQAGGRLDLAILNAGTGYFRAPSDENAALIRQTLDVNLAAPILIAQALLPFLEAAGGALALIGSTAKSGPAGLASYAASKAGLDGFARALAAEWQGRVDVLMLHPGPVATGMQARAGLDVKDRDRLFARPETMAALIARAISAKRRRADLSFAARAWSGLTGGPWR